jgi:hypothetical protein
VPKTPTGLSLPTRQDWLWTFALCILGALLGLGLNAVTGKGINLTIALGLDQPAASAPAEEAKP